MRDADRPIGDDDLQAYVDGRLDAARLRQLEAWLEQHPRRREELEADRRHRAALRAALVRADEPVPPRLRTAEIRRIVRAEHRRRLCFAAAACLVAFVGVSGGWFARGYAERPVVGQMQDATAAYRVFAADPVQPVELRAGDRTVLAEWLGGRIGRPLQIPDLQGAGLRFLGGRLLATEDGPAGLLMYEADRGERVVFYVRPIRGERRAGTHRRTEGGVETRYWFDERFGYATAGPADAGALVRATAEFRRAYAST